MTDLSVQLFSVRDALGDRTAETFARLHDLGYRDVEPYDIVSDPDGLHRLLSEAGLEAPSAHASFVRVAPEVVFDAARRIGVGTVILPSAERSLFGTREGVVELARVVNRASALAADRGLVVGYHNHEFEFTARVDGAPAWEVLVDALDERVVLQLDLHWASVGGADVFDLLHRYADRIRLLHVNDEPLGVERGFPPNPSDRGAVDAALAAAGAVERIVVEVVEQGDVFPSLARNTALFAGVAR